MDEKKLEIKIVVNTQKRRVRIVPPKESKKTKFPVPVGKILKQGAIIYSFTSGNPTCYFNLQLAPGIILQIPYPC